MEQSFGENAPLGVTLKNNINKFIYTKVYTVEHLWILSEEKADGEGVW